MAIIVPRTLFSGPPQALTATDPATAPNPAAERTPPAALSEAKATTRGMKSTLPNDREKFTPAYTHNKPNSPPRSRTYLQPAAASPSIEPVEVAACASGRGERMTARGPAAYTKIPT